MIVISKIKPGDKVSLVPLEVDCVEEGYVFASSGDTYARLLPDQIAAHHPAPREIGVGDRVIGPVGLLGTVEHVARGRAWVAWDDRFETVREISDLTLVEGDH
jgi:hypothetical protein